MQAQNEGITRLLSQRFGGGLVYLTENGDYALLKKAIESGLVSNDGQVTAFGYRVLRRATKERQ